MDGWQRLVVLQAVPTVRGAAWEIARQAYMHMPVSARVRDMIAGDDVRKGEAEGGEEDGFWIQMLLLGTDILPAAPVVEAGQGPVGRKEEEAPDEWDADDEPPPNAINTRSEEEDVRLFTFLTAQFGPTLPNRLLPLKQGHAVKLR